MARREYTAGSPTTLASAFNTGATTFTITSATNWPTSADYDFFVTIDAGTAQEERVLCSARTGTTVTVATGGRGKDGTGEKNHSQGATVWPSWSAQDADESNAHIESTGYASYSKSVHGLGSGDGDVVGTSKTQTLTNKTINSSNNTLTIAQSSVTNLTSDLASKAPLANPTFTGTVTLPTSGTGLSPVGSITMFAAATAPTGWLLCNGSAVSRTTYSGLFAVIGSGYGAGDGSTTFNLPDFLGRAPIGSGTGTGLTARTLGTKVGSESTTLTESHIPLHSHTINHDHAAFNTTGGEGAHAHDVITRKVTSSTHDHDNTFNNVGPATPPGSGAFAGTTQINAALSAGAHNHSIDVPNFTGSSGNYGTASPTAVTAVQPSTVVNFIIKH